MDSEYFCFTKMNDLNNDCLKYIFDWINLTEKVRVKSVCKLWQDVIDEMLMRWQSELIVADEHNYRYNLKNIDKFNAVRLSNISSIRTIFSNRTFRSISKFVSVNTLQISIQNVNTIMPLLFYCLKIFPKLQSLTLNGYTIEDVICCENWIRSGNREEEMKSLLSKLSALTISPFDSNLSILMKWIQSMCNLKSFEVRFTNNANNSSLFQHLPFTLIELTVSSDLSSELISSISRMSLLRRLHLDLSGAPTNHLMNDLLKTINGNEKLESLELFTNLYRLLFDFEDFRVWRQLKKMKLNLIVLTAKQFSQLIRKVPNVIELQLILDYIIPCSCHRQFDEDNRQFDEDSDDESIEADNRCKNCEKAFLRPLAHLKLLRKLNLIYNSVEIHNCLIEMLNGNQLPLLRQLRYDYIGNSHSTIICNMDSNNLIKAFCEIARKCPKELFLITIDTCCAQSTGNDEKIDLNDIDDVETEEWPRNLTISFIFYDCNADDSDFDDET